MLQFSTTLQLSANILCNFAVLRNLADICSFSTQLCHSLQLCGYPLKFLHNFAVLLYTIIRKVVEKRKRISAKLWRTGKLQRKVSGYLQTYGEPLSCGERIGDICNVADNRRIADLNYTIIRSCDLCKFYETGQLSGLGAPPELFFQVPQKLMKILN